jgi:hypothetical protein
VKATRNRALDRAFPTLTSDDHRQGRQEMGRFARRGGARSIAYIPPPNHETEAARKEHAVAGKDASAEIAARLRAMIRYSTDPAWLEDMARDVEGRPHHR